MGTTWGRVEESIDPEDNQDHPEDITSCLDDSSSHAPSSRLNPNGRTRISLSPLYGTSCKDKTSGTSCLDPEDNQDHPADITSHLDDSSGHAPSYRLDLRSGRHGAITPMSVNSCPNTESGTSCLKNQHTQPTTHSNIVSNQTSFHFS